MNAFLTLVLLSLFCVSLSCAPAWDELVPASHERGAVVFVPPRIGGKVSRSARFYLAEGEQPRLFQGELSLGQVSNIRRGDVSKALQLDEWPLLEVYDHDSGSRATHGVSTHGVSTHGVYGSAESDRRTDAGAAKPAGAATSPLAVPKPDMVSVESERCSDEVLEQAATNEMPSIDDAQSINQSHQTRAWSTLSLLAPGTSYTLITPEQYVSFTTIAAEAALERVWPTSTQTAQVAVFCASGASSPGLVGSPVSLWGTERVLFTVDEMAPTWRELGAGDNACWLWAPCASEAPTPSPPKLGSFAVEPTFVGQARDEVPTPVPCLPEELEVGVGCAEVVDDRVHIRTSEAPSLWFLTALDLGSASTDSDGGEPGAGERSSGGWFAAAPAAIGVIKGLKPETDYALRWTAFYAARSADTGELRFRTRSAVPHVVINEVMADPLGPEPDQEWVELYNDGSTPVNVEGWSLADEGRGVVLPYYEIAPSGYVLLVNDTYVRDSTPDVVPETDVAILRLPTLGTSGLSNSGETLRLTDESRIVVSTFPGTPKPAAGTSTARLAPWLSSADSNAFSLHGLPGASPGASNRWSR